MTHFIPHYGTENMERGTILAIHDPFSMLQVSDRREIA